MKAACWAKGAQYSTIWVYNTVIRLHIELSPSQSTMPSNTWATAGTWTAKVLFHKQPHKKCSASVIGNYLSDPSFQYSWFAATGSVAAGLYEERLPFGQPSNASAPLQSPPWALSFLQCTRPSQHQSLAGAFSRSCKQHVVYAGFWRMRETL